MLNDNLKFSGNYKRVPVAGILTCNNKEYWLLSNAPVHGDWETIFHDRFSVTPCYPIIGFVMVDKDNVEAVYGYARHLIVPKSGYTIEYRYDKSILVEQVNAPSEPDDLRVSTTVLYDENGNVIGVTDESMDYPIHWVSTFWDDDSDPRYQEE